MLEGLSWSDLSTITWLEEKPRVLIFHSSKSRRLMLYLELLFLLGRLVEVAF